MKRKHTLIYLVTILLALSFQNCQNQKGKIVSTTDEFNTAMENAVPGDLIIMANGTWNNAELLITAKGTKENHIQLMAEENGKVIISGQSNLRIAGEYVDVSGLVFKNGYTPTSEVISFRQKSGVYANHCRLTECVIDNFNNPDRFETELWVALYGKNNRVDHCYFVDKRSQGVTLTVRLVDKACQENHDSIDHNYFGFRESLGSNGGETMRLGTSPYSLSTSGTVVEANYFDHCDGEHEIISNKSCGNVFKDNTFWECWGTLTYRHGHDNLAENNFFFGNGKDNTGGVRIINERNKAINNYFYGLKGYRFRGALVIMNGVPNSPINRYNQVIGGVFSHNTFIDCDHVQLCAGSDAERSAVPIDSKIEDNIFYHSKLKEIFTVYDDISGIAFRNNYLNAGLKPLPGKGFQDVDMKIVKNKYGVLVPESSAIKNAGCNLEKPIATPENTGVSWYPRKSGQLKFGSGERLVVEPGLNTLSDAIKRSKAGDVLVLKTGEYLSSKNLFIEHPLTVKAQSGEKPLLTSEKNNMFTIENEGALKLSGLTISGEKSPDMAGNGIVSTSKYSMNRNYKLIVEDCDIKNLDVNYSFDFLKVYKSTFADSIVIRNSHFSNITGHVLSLDKEYEDLGIYNAEYVVIENSDFSNIGNAVLNLYRGGTDESTFGPFLTISNCKITNCGNGKRNKEHHAISLHGVQWASIDQLNMIESADFNLFLSNGEPVTKISNLNIYPKGDIVSNSKKYQLTGLTHHPEN